MRVDEDQPWHPFHLGQPLWNFVNALFFEYGIAAYDLELGATLKKNGKTKDPEFQSAGQEGARARSAGRWPRTTSSTRRCRARRSCTRWRRTSPPTRSATCGATRSSCAATSPRASRPSRSARSTGETSGDWYVRQMLGSANISGSKLMHIMTGNLCHQIEHHLFPDLPSQPVRRDRAQGAGAVREVRPELLRRARCPAGLLGLAPGGPAVAAQRLAGRPPTPATPRSSWPSSTR